MQSDSNVVSTLINEQQITELATNGRNVIGWPRWASASAETCLTGCTILGGSSFAISFNGLNQAHNIWIDRRREAYDRGSGGKMSVMPSQDALGEFQVLACNYPPDYGIASGGTITMSIKSGTSKSFHGELGNSIVTTLSMPTTTSTTTTANLRREAESDITYTARNVGGPVFIPHVYNSSRTGPSSSSTKNGARKSTATRLPHQHYSVSRSRYFGVSIQLRACLRSTPARNGSIVPTRFADPALEAKFTAAGLTTGQPFPNNTIPGNLLDSNALLFNTLKNIPAATNQGG